MKNKTIGFGSIFACFVLMSLLCQPIVADIYEKEIGNSANFNFYYINSYHHVEKRYRGGSGGDHISYDVSDLHFDAELDELFLNVILNYSAEMNYYPILRLRDYVAPMLVCGIMVENYTDYKWGINKMNNFGYDYIEGNITFEIQIDMDSIKSGDILKLKTYFVSFLQSHLRYSDPIPDEATGYWALLLRILYHIPIVGKNILYNWYLPTIEKQNYLPERNSSIWLYFD